MTITQYASVFCLATTLPLFSQTTTTILLAEVDGAVQSSGALGLSVVDDEFNATIRSGGSNIRQSVYEFNLAGIGTDRTVLGAYFEVDTRAVSNTGTNPVILRLDGYIGDGSITVGDFDMGEAAGGTLLSNFSLVVGDSGSTSLALEILDFSPLQAAITNDEDYFGIRTETDNFAFFQVSSLENTFGDAAPSLRIVLYQ